MKVTPTKARRIAGSTRRTNGGSGISTFSVEVVADDVTRGFLRGGVAAGQKPLGWPQTSDKSLRLAGKYTPK